MALESNADSAFLRLRVQLQFMFQAMLRTYLAMEDDVNRYSL